MAEQSTGRGKMASAQGVMNSPRYAGAPPRCTGGTCQLSDLPTFRLVGKSETWRVGKLAGQGGGAVVSARGVVAEVRGGGGLAALRVVPPPPRYWWCWVG